MTMKKILGLTGLALASALVLAACSSSNSNSTETKKQEVVFATSGATAPFAYVENDELTGFDIEVAKAVFEGSDKYNVTFQKTEWSSMFSGLDSSKYQMAGVNISYSEERAGKYLYSYPTGATPQTLVVTKDSDITKYDDIAGHSTQVVQGTTSVKQLEEFNKSHADNPVELKFSSENITQTLTALDDGKFDFKLFDAPTVNAIIKQNGLDNLKTIDLESSEMPYIYFLFASEQEDLQKFVNGRIEELYKDGTIAKLAEKYLGSAKYIPAEDDLKVPTGE